MGTVLVPHLVLPDLYRCSPVTKLGQLLTLWLWFERHDPSRSSFAYMRKESVSYQSNEHMWSYIHP